MLFESISDLFRIKFMFMLILAMCVASNLLRKDVLSLLSSFSSIKLILSVDGCSRQEYMLVFGFVIFASEYLYLRESVGKLALFHNFLITGIKFITNLEEP